MYPFSDEQDTSQDISPLLRRRSIFGLDPNPVGPKPYNIQFDTAPPAPQQPEDRMMGAYGKILDAGPGPATKRYKDFLDQETPDRANYSPTKTQRLAAILTGINANFSRHGNGKGAEVTQNMLEDPFNRAMSEYKIKAGRYKEAADVEEKDIANRVKTYRDIIQDQTAQRNAGNTAALNDARIQHWQNQDRDMTMKGYTKTTNKLDGHIYYTKINPDGTINKIDAGKMDETPDEKTSRGNKQHQTFANIDLGRQKNYFDFTNPKIEAREKDIIDYRDTKEMSKEERANLEWAARQKNNPQRQFAQRALALRQIADERPELKSKIDLTTYNTDDPNVIALMNAKIKQMNDNLTKKPSKDNKPRNNTPGLTPGRDPRIIQGVEDQE
jgi:hypothetical protein